MSFPLARMVAGLALLAALATGCGSAATGHAAAGKPAAAKPAAAAHSAMPSPSAMTHSPARDPVMVHRHHRHHHARRMHAAASPPPAAPATTQPVNPIPQGNGGDQDGDNNGGPSDGDGNV